MEFPNRGPYDPAYENLPAMPEGMVPHQYPYDVKFLNDPGFYDTLGRSPVEQREVLTKNRSDEEQVHMIKQILDEHPTNNETGKGYEWTICLEAAMKGSAAVMKYLVREKGLTKANAHDPEFLNTEVLIASYNGFIEVVQVLIDEADMSVNLDLNGETPLIRALNGGKVEMVNWLLERGADWSLDEQRVFSAAVWSGKLELLEKMLRLAMSANPDKPSTTWIKGRMLAEAAMTASEPMTKFIVEHGDYPLANEASLEQRLVALDAVNFSLKNDETNPVCFQLALDRALATDESGTFIKNDHQEALKSFRFSIGVAIARGKLDYLRKMLELLFQATHVTQNSGEFRSILKYAIRRCYDPVSKDCAVELLEKYGADPNSSSEDGDDMYGTPLSLGAVGRNDPEWTKFWLDRGADIHFGIGKFCDGPTALANAIRFREYENVMVLLQYGGPVDRMEAVDKMVGKKALLITVAGATQETFFEKGEVELGEIPNEDWRTDLVRIRLDFEEGVSEEWLERIQFRKPAVDLELDGTGRSTKNR